MSEYSGFFLNLEITVDSCESNRYGPLPISFLLASGPSWKDLERMSPAALMPRPKALAEPRASKGRAGFSDRNQAALRQAARGAALVVLFGHPRLVEQMPEGPPVLLAWHRQRLMQHAVARWLRERIR